jgi:hypothetical protein
MRATFAQEVLVGSVSWFAASHNGVSDLFLGSVSWFDLIHSS